MSLQAPDSWRDSRTCFPSKFHTLRFVVISSAVPVNLATNANLSTVFLSTLTLIQIPPPSRRPTLQRQTLIQTSSSSPLRKSTFQTLLKNSTKYFLSLLSYSMKLCPYALSSYCSNIQKFHLLFISLNSLDVATSTDILVRYVGNYLSTPQISANNKVSSKTP